MERFVLPVWDMAVSIVRRKSEASSEALEAPSIMRMHLGGEVHVPVDFRLLDAKAYGLSSPVIVGADLYLAAKVKRRKYYEIGFGYSFEHVCLYAESLGLGTVMLAASLSRAAFEKRWMFEKMRFCLLRVQSDILRRRNPSVNL